MELSNWVINPDLKYSFPSCTIRLLRKKDFIMPILRNAKKALRVSKRKAAMNRPVKSRVKTVLDNFKKKPTAETLSLTFSAIDKAVKKNIFHKKKAARLKSQAAKLVK
jgi:small subunit ribosomal protein S20